MTDDQSKPVSEAEAARIARQGGKGSSMVMEASNPEHFRQRHLNLDIPKGLRYDENICILTGRINSPINLYRAEHGFHCDFLIAQALQSRHQWVITDKTMPDHVTRSARIAVFGDMAKQVHKYFEKGMHVYIRGSLITDEPRMIKEIMHRTHSVMAHEIKIMGTVLSMREVKAQREAKEGKK